MLAGGTHSRATPSSAERAARPVGVSGGVAIVMETSAVRAEGRLLAMARAAKRSVEPGSGIGSSSTILSPGATRRLSLRATLSKSPSPSARNSSTSRIGRRSWSA
jgi:hypothetical protein